MLRVNTIAIAALMLLSAGCGYGSKYNGGMGAGMPTLMQLSPNSEPPGSGTFTLVAKGSGFGTDSVVYFNGTAHMTTYGTSSQVSATIDASEVMTSGMIPVYVRSAGANSNIIDFSVQ